MAAQSMNRGVVAGAVALCLGLGAGIAVGGCGEDRGSVDVEGTSTGSTGSTVETTSTTETTETTGTTESP